MYHETLFITARMLGLVSALWFTSAEPISKMQTLFLSVLFQYPHYEI
jgi:hypothetical protein